MYGNAWRSNVVGVNTRFYKRRIDPFENQRGLTSLRFLFRFPRQNFDAYDERFQKSVLNKQVYPQVATSRVLCRIANYRNKYTTNNIRTPSSLPSKPSHLPPIPQVLDNAVGRYEREMIIQSGDTVMRHLFSVRGLFDYPCRPGCFGVALGHSTGKLDLMRGKLEGGCWRSKSFFKLVNSFTSGATRRSHVAHTVGVLRNSCRNSTCGSSDHA